MKHSTTCVILPKTRNSASLVTLETSIFFFLSLPSIIVITLMLLLIIFPPKCIILSTMVKFSQFTTGIIYYMFSWVFCFLNIVLKVHLFACSSTMLILCCIVFHCMNILQFLVFFLIPFLLLMDFNCTKTNKAALNILVKVYILSCVYMKFSKLHN